MKTAFALSFVAMMATTAAFAQADVIKERQQMMKHAGGATALAGKMLKGAAPFELGKVQDALKAYVDLADKAPKLFPAGSQNGDTGALPAVWTERADFDKRFVKLAADAKAAQAAITDEFTFQEQFPKVLKNCGGCHEHYRAKEH